MKNAIEVESPIGVLLIESNGEAITQITLPGSGDPASLEATMSKKPAKSQGSTNTAKTNTAKTKTQTQTQAASDEADGVLARAEAQLAEYFAGKRTEFDLPLELDGTEFQRDVWLTLAEIPYGKTISYAELASMVGRPSAFRAVGQANGANPIPIVLPCHRVIASGGGIGGYGGGLDMKRQLLAMEGVDGIS